jgi:spore germination protein YaaH
MSLPPPRPLSPLRTVPPLLVLGTGLLALGGCAPAPVREITPATAPPRYHVAGYHPWWTGDAWRTYDFTTLDELFFFSVEVAADGSLATRHGWPDVWFEMNRHALRQGTRVAPALTLTGEEAFVTLFGSEAATRTLHTTLVDLLRDSPALTGLHLDFERYEAVPEGVRAGATAFVRALRLAMDELRPGLTLSLFVSAYDAADVFDERALAPLVNFFVVQGYDLHYRNDEQAGPVAAPAGWGRRNWGTLLGRLERLGVPREKILLAVPYFGYEWPTETGAPGSRTRGPGVLLLPAAVDTAYVRGDRKVGPAGAARYGLRRDPESRTPYYAYQDSTGWHQGWFEDAESLRAKYEFVLRENLGGIAVFPLGYGDATLEAVRREAFGRAPRP